MTKESPRPETAPAPLAPLFQLWRTALEEAERNADHWAQHGASQIEEATQVGRALGAQILTASRRVVDGMERVAVEAAAHAASFGKSFGRSAA